jgi:splicing factor 45
MYGGLFGDLPSTKKAQSSDNNNATKETDTGGAPKLNSPQNEQPEPSNKKRPASLVDKLGTAGTTMAFVPAALRNRKRVNSNVAPAASSAKPTSSSNTTKAATSVKESSISHIHEDNDSSLNDNTTIDTEQKDEIESDAMRELHASVVDTDIYDPHVPNDLLAFWDAKAMERERLELEREAKETLQRQEHLRQQLEQERADLEKSGDLEKLVQHREQRSMGRGRGVSNLPAWLVEKQKKQQQQVGSETTSPPVDNVVVENKSLRTIILSNLTAPGDIDDDLAEEVKEECEEQCGPVTSVTVRDARPPHQPVVQVHVEFGTSQDAYKGVTVFHGRKFGSRRITAEFMRE